MKSLVNLFTCSDMSEQSHVNCMNWDVLRLAGFNPDNFINIHYSTDGSGCDVYNFNIEGSKKVQHVGLYNSKIEFSYAL